MRRARSGKSRGMHRVDRGRLMETQEGESPTSKMVRARDKTPDPRPTQLATAADPASCCVTAPPLAHDSPSECDRTGTARPLSQLPTRTAFGAEGRRRERPSDMNSRASLAISARHCCSPASLSRPEEEAIQCLTAAWQRRSSTTTESRPSPDGAGRRLEENIAEQASQGTNTPVGPVRGRDRKGSRRGDLTPRGMRHAGNRDKRISTSYQAW